MHKLITISTLLAASVAVFGCKKSSQISSTTPDPRARDDAKHRAPTGKRPQKQEVAKGELRDALVHLQRVHFGLDTSALLPAARNSLERAATSLAAHSDVQLYVDGHTDDRGTDEYNIGLGERRAGAVIDYLVRLGVERDRLHAISFGEEQPLQPGERAEDYAANRRVDFRLMRGDVELVLEDGHRFEDDGAQIDAKTASVSLRP